MRFGREQLRDKALLALEETVQECRYRAPRRSHAIRFALAYLWTLTLTGRAPFLEFWRAMAGDNDLHRFDFTDRALAGIYLALGLERDDRITWELWSARQEEERDARHRQALHGKRDG